MNGKTFTCATCSGTFDHLEEFPGSVCLQCWSDSPEGRYVPTARELTRMWGGK